MQETEQKSATPEVAREKELRERMQKMVEDGKALVVTTEEMEMLRSFRRFKGGMRRDGEVFKWQTRRPVE